MGNPTADEIVEVTDRHRELAAEAGVPKVAAALDA